MADNQQNDYEAQRQARIEANTRKMAEMGLLEASRSLASAAGATRVTLEAGVEHAPRLKKRRTQEALEPSALEPTRLSRRLRGETAPALSDVAAAARAEAEAEGRARRGATRKRLTVEPGVQLAAPFSLWSIGVTVWELGQVHRGAWAHRYWSSSGCLYHHAYPVGFRATKVQFGRTYEMRIEEGPTGPMFKVIDQQTGAVFTGTSPTKPWTDVCIAHRTGQRISGPLFFGFSDPLTQRAIAVNLYSDEELRAALQGDAVQAAATTPEEAAAKEFAAVDGIGEATAILLAKTTALGGRRHSSLDSLREWARASDGNAQVLFDYLTGSEEVPEATLRWPAWCARLAPKIVLALSGRWMGEGPPPGAAAAAAATGGGGSEPGAEADQPEDAMAAAAAGQANDLVHAGSGQAQQQQLQHQEQQQKQRQKPEKQPAGGNAKENKQPCKAKPKAAPAATTAAAGRSRRERRVNTQLAEFSTGGDN